jgi:tRNA(fMet)-specific endonuclease VapC
MHTVSSESLYISPVSLAELEYGLHLTNVDPSRAQAARAALRSYVLLPIDHHTAQYYGRIRAELFQRFAPRDHKGKVKTRYSDDLIDLSTGKQLGIQENDLWIVAIAVQYNLSFVTGDRAGGMRRVLHAAVFSCAYDDRTVFLP